MTFRYDQKYTIFVIGYRAQIQVIDLTSKDIAPSIRNDKVIIFAYVLPSYTNKFTAFCLGKQIYWGHSLNKCLSIIKEKLKLSDIQLPKSFTQYMDSFPNNPRSVN